MRHDGRAAPFDGMLEGRSLFLVCGGYSAKECDLEQLKRRGIVSMCVNNAWLMFRPDIFVCVDPPDRFIDTGWKDAGIMKCCPKNYIDSRLKFFHSETKKKVHSKFCVGDMPNTWFFVRTNQFDPGTFFTSDEVTWGNTEKHPKDSVGVANQRSVMLAALQIAAWLRPGNIYLVGVDFHMDLDPNKPAYAFGEQKHVKGRQSNNGMFKGLAKRLETLKPGFEKLGIQIRNCNPKSGLRVFPFISYDEAVNAAAKECEKPVPSKGWY